jgi:hypothetical protein
MDLLSPEWTASTIEGGHSFLATTPDGWTLPNPVAELQSAVDMCSAFAFLLASAQRPDLRVASEPEGGQWKLQYASRPVDPSESWVKMRKVDGTEVYETLTFKVTITGHGLAPDLTQFDPDRHDLQTIMTSAPSCLESRTLPLFGSAHEHTESILGVQVAWDLVDGELGALTVAFCVENPASARSRGEAVAPGALSMPDSELTEGERVAR